MALIVCPECNKEYSDKAKACPLCGFPTYKIRYSKDISKSIKTDNTTKSSFNYKKIIVIMFCLIILMLVVFEIIYRYTVKDVVFSQNSISVCIDEEISLDYSVYPENAINNKVKWSSSDENVAIVNDGIIVGVSEGTCKIIVESGGHIDKCNVTVNSAENIQKGLINNLCVYVDDNCDITKDGISLKYISKKVDSSFMLGSCKGKLCLIYQVEHEFQDYATYVFLEKGNIESSKIVHISNLIIDGSVMKTESTGEIQISNYSLGDKIYITSIEAENAPSDVQIGVTTKLNEAVDDGTKNALIGFKQFLSSNPEYGELSQYGFSIDE